MKHIIPHPNQQRAFKELREEFRRDNEKRILDSLKNFQVDVGPLKYVFASDEKPFETDCWVTDEGEVVYLGEFEIATVPWKLVSKIQSQAQECEKFLAAELPPGEGVDHDGPPLPTEMLCDEQALLDYMESLCK